ncbi:molybdopterin biosynthesis protein [Candidatus Desantisbacteria bacterium]|nr:molybdopterin biosynthesis protein [Candidatus Desantisbacteria bacterium]
MLGRVTAESVIARICSPHYHSAAMDGVAVKAENLIGASEVSPINLVLGRDAVLINTGNPIPQGMDAVIKIEDVCIQSETIRNSQFAIRNPQLVEVMTPVVPYQHVRLLGEDIVAGEMVLTTNHLIRPQDIGAMLAAGVVKVWVKKKPQVIIIPTGDELVQPGESLKPGAIIEFNSRMLGSMIYEWGGEAVVSEIVPDSYEKIRDKVLEAAALADMVIINAGSSAGTKDYTAQIIRELGELLVHGVTMMPGKPVALGIMKGSGVRGQVAQTFLSVSAVSEDRSQESEVGGQETGEGNHAFFKTTPVVGIPGFPVSALLAMEEFVMPLIRHALGLNVIQREKVQAVITQKIASRLGMEEFIRVGVGYFPERKPVFVAVPQRQGAGIITSMVRADGILRIPRLCEGLEDNSIVEVELFKSKQQIESNIILIGSHDNLLYILSDCLSREYPQMSLCVTNVGSLGGLLSLRRGDCHLTTSHLLDEATGTYNLPYIKRFLPNMDVSVITIAWRQQGLIVKKGNPKNIHGLTDLTHDDVVFVNRQKGAGTRILLDYELNKAGISAIDVRGYNVEVFTHMAVCASIDAGTADVGLGIMSSADIFGMDFIPIAKERYDMVIPRRNLSLPGVSALLKVINSPKFHARVSSIKGYDLNECGCEL